MFGQPYKYYMMNKQNKHSLDLPNCYLVVDQELANTSANISTNSAKEK